MLKVYELSVFKLSELPFLSWVENGTFPSEWKQIENSFARINLIFTDQPSLVMESGVHPSM